MTSTPTPKRKPRPKPEGGVQRTKPKGKDSTISGHNPNTGEEFTLIAEAPPPRRLPGRRSEQTWYHRLLPLIDRPNEWFRIYEANHEELGSIRSVVTRINNRTLVNMPNPDDEWEVTFRTTLKEGGDPDNPEDKIGYLYARYLGPA